MTSLTLRKKHGKSQCLIEVFRFCDQQNLIRLQLLNKHRFYKVFAHAIIHPLCIFRPRGISLKNNSPCIRLFDTVWRDFLVFEQNEFKKQRENYFRWRDQSDLTCSKIVQVNRFHVYIIGGFYPSLVCGEYDVARSCLRVDLGSGLLERMNDMLHARNAHAIAFIGK